MYSSDAAQQSRTESIQKRLRHRLYGRYVTLEHRLQPSGISCILVFNEGGEPENREKNPQSGDDNQHELNPLMRRVWESNLNHIGGRRMPSSLRRSRILKLIRRKQNDVCKYSRLLSCFLKLFWMSQLC